MRRSEALPPKPHEHETRLAQQRFQELSQIVLTISPVRFGSFRESTENSGAL
jgi:hypothetical protein